MSLIDSSFWVYHKTIGAKADDEPPFSRKAARGDLGRPFSCSDAWVDGRRVAHRPTSRADPGRAQHKRHSKCR